MASSRRTSNKVATLVLMDVGRLMGSDSGSGKSFLDRAQCCASRIILRQIFAGDFDETGLISFGSEVTDNPLADGGDNYANIQVLADMSFSSSRWETLEKIRALKPSGIKNPSWAEALIVALDHLKTSTLGRNFKDKQIVLISNFRGRLNFSDEHMKILVDVVIDCDVKLVVIGVDVKNETESESSILLRKLLRKLDTGTAMSFQDAEKELEYYKTKRKSPRLQPVFLEIGTDIKIPVHWVKLNRDRQKVAAVWKEEELEPEPEVPESTVSKGVPEVNKSSAPGYSMTTDDAKTAFYGTTKIPLNYADLEAMKKKSTEATFTLIGCTKRKNVNPLMLVGGDVYAVQPRPLDGRSVAALSAFVDALLDSDRVGVAKRVLTRNGKCNIGALLPLSDQMGKHLYFLKLPMAEWVRHVPPLCKQMELDDKEKMSSIDEFIDSKLLPTDLHEEDRGILLPDPSFQNYCHLLASSALDENSEFDSEIVPEFVRRIIDPCPESSERSEAALARLNVLFPVKPEAKQAIVKRKRSDRNMDNDYELFMDDEDDEFFMSVGNVDQAEFIKRELPIKNEPDN